MDCIFCRIASGEIPARIAHRTEHAIVFHDLAPQAPVHLLAIPVRHYTAARDATGPEGQAVLGAVMQAATEAATAAGLDAGGYRLVANTGSDGGQSVFHLHVHVLGGRAMTWPPG